MEPRLGEFRFLSEEEFRLLDSPSQFAYLREAFEILQVSRTMLPLDRTSANDDSSSPPPKGGRAHRY